MVIVVPFQIGCQPCSQRTSVISPAPIPKKSMLIKARPDPAGAEQIPAPGRVRSQPPGGDLVLVVIGGDGGHLLLLLESTR